LQEKFQNRTENARGKKNQQTNERTFWHDFGVRELVIQLVCSTLFGVQPGAANLCNQWARATGMNSLLNSFGKPFREMKPFGGVTS
jgi:hypothetical protein